MLFCEIYGQRGWSWLLVSGWTSAVPESLDERSKGNGLQNVRHDKRERIAKRQKVPPKRADSQTRSGSFWFLVAEFSLGLKRLGGCWRERLDCLRDILLGLLFLSNQGCNEPISVAGGCPGKKEKKKQKG